MRYMEGIYTAYKLKYVSEQTTTKVQCLKTIFEPFFSLSFHENK